MKKVHLCVFLDRNNLPFGRRVRSLYAYAVDILSRYPQNLIIRSGGVQGPYKELTGFVGNPDMPISASWNSPDGLTKVDWPAEKGYYFQVNVYENKQKGIFWVLLKLPNSKPTP